MARILLLEDDPLQLRLYSLYLQHHGHQVISADREDLLPFIAEQGIEMIVTDIVMPDRWGWEVIAEVRGRYGPALPIVAISGGLHDDPRSYLARAATLGATTTLAKPFALDSLRKAVDEALALRPISDVH